MNALSTITVLPSTKKEQANYISIVKEAILSGEQNPLIIARQLNSFAGVLKELAADKEIKEYFLDEAKKHSAKTFDLGAKFTIQERSTYDFTSDSKWSDLNASIEVLKAKLKEREEFLKHVKEPFADIETGEVINPMPFTTNQILTITLNKE